MAVYRLHYAVMAIAAYCGIFGQVAATFSTVKHRFNFPLVIGFDRIIPYS